MGRLCFRFDHLLSIRLPFQTACLQFVVFDAVQSILQTAPRELRILHTISRVRVQYLLLTPK